MTALLVGLAGGLGASTRYLVDGLMRRCLSASSPLSTVFINITGSLAIGLVTGAAPGPSTLRLVLATGFCGGYTTFGTAMFETVRLYQQGRALTSLLNWSGTAVIAVAATSIGIALGS